MFQSLLCWIMVCKGTSLANPLDRLLFQSLLCWIMVCKRVAIIMGGSMLGFQSLLCWIMVCKTVSSVLFSVIMRCFNPCYVGLWSVRDCQHPNGRLDKWFQSLLCWIMVCKFGLHEVYLVPYFSFQSLLCWIMVCKQVRRPHSGWRAGVSILVMLDYGL